MADPVLAGTDGSPAGRRAVRWAAAEAALRQRPLALVAASVWPVGAYSVIPRSQVPALAAVREEDREQLREQADAVRAEFPDVTVTEELVEDEPAGVIVDRSRTAVLTVVGQRGRGGLSGLLLGSVSDKVATYAAGTVVVVPDEPVSDGPVVLGVDGSRGSGAAAAFAFEEASRRQAELVAVRAWAAPPVRGAYQAPLHPSPLPVDPDELAAGERRLLSESLAECTSTHPDVRVRPVLEYGLPVDQLLAHADGARLLVVGSRGRGGFTGMLLGSTSRSLLHRARCPVAVVRP